MIIITKEELKVFFSHYHGFSSPENNIGKNGALSVFDKLSGIQFDPLNVVGRNADLVLFSRVADYQKNYLSELLYKDRLLVDGWDKQMGIYQIKDFPYYTFIREHMGIEVKKILNYRNQAEALELLETVLEFIKDSGPIESAKIKLGKSKKGIWGHGNLSSVACDYLWNIGKLGIAEKNNVIKKYDLIENVVDQVILNKQPHSDMEEFLKWYIKRRVGSLGIIWNKNGGAWLGPFVNKKDLRTPILQSLVAEGELLEVKVDGLKDIFYIRQEDVCYLKETQATNTNARFLAPLDNLLWDRKLIKEIYNFDYSWEVYIPVEKRKYGYYVLPVLYKNNIIARFEPKVTRSNDKLEINQWWWEKDVIPDAEMIDCILKEFERLGSFLEVNSIDTEKIIDIMNVKDIKKLV